MGLRPVACILCSCLLTAACGGGAPAVNTANPPLTSLPLFDPLLNTTPQTLALVGINDANSSAVRQTGSLTGVAISGTLLDGTVDQANSRVALSGGGAASLTTNAAASQAFGFSTGSIFGVAGIPATSLPGGNKATYTGQVTVVVQDDILSEVMTGALTANANFRNSLISLNAPSINSTNRSGALQITNASIVGTRISGGQFDLTGNFNNLPVNSRVTHAGQFFGATGQEIGGVIHKDETGSGNPLKVFGTYAAD